MTNLLDDPECTYYKKTLHESKQNSKMLFKICNSLLGCNTILPLPPGLSCNELAGHFNTFFISKISKIRSGLEDLMLCRAVRGRELKISFLLSFSCLGEIILLHIYCVLRYTTARLQVLFSSRHLGGITKGCSNNYDSKSLLLYFY